MPAIRAQPLVVPADDVGIAGAPKKILSGIVFSADASSSFASVTPDGTVLYRPVVSERRRLVWYDRRGRESSTVFEEDDIENGRISPDGKRLLVNKFVPERGTSVVLRADLERGTRTILTPPPRVGWNGLWLPDGERFVFTSVKSSSDYDLFIQDDDPRAEPVALWEARSDDKQALSVTPDGKHLIAREDLPATSYDLWLVPLERGAPRRLLIGGTGNETYGEVSPDGKWLLYNASVSGGLEVYVRLLTGGRSYQVSTAGGLLPRWGREGSEVFFLAPDRSMMSASFRVQGAVPAIGVPTALFQLDARSPFEWDLSVDGESFLINELAGSASPVRPYNLVSGWKDTLPRD